jgi:hypothetical protein
MLLVPGRVKVGESAGIAMSVKNDADKSIKLRFASTDLTSASGGRIAARQVQFSPAVVTLKPHQAEDIKVVVGVPRGKPSGTYIGLVHAAGKDQSQAVLVIQVN